MSDPREDDLTRSGAFYSDMYGYCETHGVECEGNGTECVHKVPTAILADTIARKTKELEDADLCRWGFSKGSLLLILNGGIKILAHASHLK